MTLLILMAWADGSVTLRDRFAEGRWAWDGRRTAVTYQGFIKALRRAGLAWCEAVAWSLRRALVAVAGDHARRFGFFVLAVDGSRFELPRTAAHQRAFGTGGKADGSPQMWVTLLWHMGVGVPWAWRLGRADASERDHLRQMLRDTPAETLLVADAGFTGYNLLREVIASGRHMLLRIGAGVELLRGGGTLGYVEHVDAQTVHLWPTQAQRRRQPPLVLRLIQLRDQRDRRRKLYLLTSVTDPQQLSDAQAATLYRMRWGVELCYRALKQTLAKRKLRSHGPEQARFEMHGLLCGLTLLGLWTVQAIVQRGHDPLCWSVAAALRVVRAGIRQPQHAQTWLDRLGHALKDQYVRQRKTRHRDWPRKKRADPPPRPPRIRRPTNHERTLAHQLAQN